MDTSEALARKQDKTDSSLAVPPSSSDEDIADISHTRGMSQMATARFDEYRLIIEDLISLGARRQTTNQVFVALNSLFLTALGALLLSTNPFTVRTSLILGVLSLFALIFNGAWWRSLGLYRSVYRIESGYAEGIERLLRETGLYGEAEVYGHPTPFGFISLLNTHVYRGSKRMLTRFERGMALTFMFAYPLLALVIGILTFLIAQRLVSPIR